MFGKREHMRMGFLADKLDKEKKRALDMIIEGIIMVRSEESRVGKECRL